MEGKIKHSRPVPPFLRWCSATIPAAFDDSLTYYEALCSLWKWLQTNLVEVVNNNATVTQEYIQMVNELKEFVDNYFENLNVQEEINNKLDEMAEDGTLQEIVASYLQANVTWTFDSVADMQAATNLSAGSYAKTIGYYEPDDGGASMYYIDDDNAVADGGSVINLSSGLKAHLVVIEDMVSVNQFGAKGDGTTDDTTAISNALKFRKDDYIKIIFDKSSTYVAAGEIFIYSNTDIDLNDSTILAPTNLKFLTEKEAMITSGYGAVKNISIKNGTIKNTSEGVTFCLFHTDNVVFDTINFKDCAKASHVIDMGGCSNVLINNCVFDGFYISTFHEIIQTDYADYDGLPYWGNDPDYAYDDLPTVDVTLSNCEFKKGNGTNYPNAIGTHAIYGNLPIKNITIINNKFDGFTYSAIRYPNIDGLLIKNNIFVNNEVNNLGSDRYAIRLYSKWSAEVYPDIYCKNITIDGNRFIRTTNRINMSAIDLEGRSDSLVTNAKIVNNYYDGAWADSSDDYDFVHLSNINDVTIENNIINQPKIAIYLLGSTDTFNVVKIANNEFNGMRDVFKALSGTPYPASYTFDNNIIVKSGKYLNNTKFYERFTIDSDYTASGSEVKIINFTLPDTSVFTKNSENKILIPAYLNTVTVGGTVVVTPAAAKNFFVRLNKWRNNGDGTKGIYDVRCYTTPDGRYAISIPETTIEVPSLEVVNGLDQVWLSIQLASGDKIFAEGTEITIRGN